jgi:CRISPR system Cascade subunit CasB
MSRESDKAFTDHLLSLKERDRGALATLRRSLAFDPGDDPRSFRHVERYVGRDWHASDARRRALYAIAGLFAAHPDGHERSLAAALGQVLRVKERPSLELRFLALLEANADSVMPHLRQAVSLLAAEGVGYSHSALLADLHTLLDEGALPDHRDRIKRQWARDFYRALQAEPADASSATASADLNVR